MTDNNKTSSQPASTIWGGRFAAGPSEIMAKINKLVVAGIIQVK